jgi:hypothetical protein
MASRLSRSPARTAARPNACFALPALPAKLSHDPHQHEDSIRHRLSMLNRYTLSGLGVLFVLVALFLLHANEEDKILEVLDELRALTEISSPETGIEQLTKARQIGQFFSERTIFDLINAGHGTIEIDNRDELVQRIIRGRARLASLELTLQDAQVSIEDDMAEVVLQGSGLGQVNGEQERFLEIHTVAIRLLKVADDWLVSGATHLRDERQRSPERRD